MSCHVVGQTNLETALYAYIFEYFVTTSASPATRRGVDPFYETRAFAQIYFLLCVYFTIVPTKVCAPALFKIYTV